MNKHVLFPVCDQPLSKYLRLSWSGFMTPFCHFKQPKLGQLLYLTGPCRSDIGVLLKASITLPSADIYRVTTVTLGNTRHTAVPKLGCWKLSALQLVPTLLGVGREEWGVSNPALERQQRCIPTNVGKHNPLVHQKKSGINIWIPDEAFNPLQMDQPKAFQALWCASTPLDQ